MIKLCIHWLVLTFWDFVKYKYKLILPYNIWVEYLKWYNVAYIFFKFHKAFPMMLKINFTLVIGSCLHSVVLLSNLVCCCSLWWWKISAPSCCFLCIQGAGFVLQKLHSVLCLIAICVYVVYLIYVEKEQKKNTGMFMSNK